MFYARSSSGVTRPFVRQLLQLLLPSPCLACREAVWEPRGSLGLCPPCRALLVRWPQSGCARCGGLRRGAAAGEHCRDCRRQAPPYDRLVATWCYQPPLDQVVTAFKFRRLDYLGEHLGRAMARLHQDLAGACEVVVPVPLYWTRYLARGYNQAALIARPLARELGLPLERPLARRRATAHQSRLGRRARRSNLEHAFVARQSARLRGRRVLLVDDVTTTGATLAAAACCLRQAGARSVVAAAAARTPAVGERALLLGAAVAGDERLC